MVNLLVWGHDSRNEHNCAFLFLNGSADHSNFSPRCCVHTSEETEIVLAVSFWGANIAVGIQLQMQGLTANQLRESVDHVLNQSSFHKAAAKMKETLQKSAGYQQAVDEIFEFKSKYDI